MDKRSSYASKVVRSTARTGAIALYRELEALGEVLLDFSTGAVLATWLDKLEQDTGGAIMELG